MSKEARIGPIHKNISSLMSTIKARALGMDYTEDRLWLRELLVDLQRVADDYGVGVV